MHILIVEDEWKTTAYLGKVLSENGFVVDVAVQGENGLHCTCMGHYDFILSLMLRHPGKVLSRIMLAEQL